MPRTAESMAKKIKRTIRGREDILAPKNNIALGAAYLGRLARTYAHHPLLVIAGYNGGQGNIKRWLDARGDQPMDLWVEDIPYDQTRNYTKRVATSYWRYRWLYGEKPVFEGLDPAQSAEAASQDEGHSDYWQ